MTMRLSDHNTDVSPTEFSMDIKLDPCELYISVN